MQLAMPHIQTHHLRSALLQQAIGEAAGALPHIEATQTLGSKAAAVQRTFKLQTTARHVTCLGVV